MHIDQVTLKTSSLEKTKVFYTQVLGLSIEEENEKVISFTVGNSVLCFEIEENTDAFYHFAFNIAEDIQEEAMQYIEQKGVSILDLNGNRMTHFIDWNAKSFYFYDNNNNIVEFIARRDLNYVCDQPFDHNALKEISEVGFVVENVKRSAQTLQKEYNIPLFRRGPESESFTVLGDDHGLILLSAIDRGWYPTNIPAKPYPISVRCNHGHIELKLTH